MGLAALTQISCDVALASRSLLIFLPRLDLASLIHLRHKYLTDTPADPPGMRKITVHQCSILSVWSDISPSLCLYGLTVWWAIDSLKDRSSLLCSLFYRVTLCYMAPGDGYLVLGSAELIWCDMVCSRSSSHIIPYGIRENNVKCSDTGFDP